MATFAWDEEKNQENQTKHGVSFERAQYAFADPHRLILRDKRHSTRDEERYFCVGHISGGIVTVRFVRRGETIRIFGAGFWREYRALYLERKR